MKSKTGYNRLAKQRDRALEAYVEALLDHKGNGANAIVAGKRRKFERATMDLHEALKGA